MRNQFVAISVILTLFFAANIQSLAEDGFFIDSGQKLGDADSIGIELGDLDGDNDLDAIIANFGANNKVWLNDGKGNFTDSGQNIGDLNSVTVAQGDLDGDNDLDAILYKNKVYEIWLNDGNGNFNDSGQNIGDPICVSVALGDVDGDNDLDAFIITYDPNKSYDSNKIWLNDGSGNFSNSGQEFGRWGGYNTHHSPALGDVDGDKDLDAFYIVSYGSMWWYEGRIELNDGNGNFNESKVFAAGKALRGYVLGDLDNDGDLDVYWPWGNSPDRVYMNDGVGNFTWHCIRSWVGANNISLALGDLDGDTGLDLFSVRDRYETSRVYINDGSGCFTDSGQELGDSPNNSVALGDVDGDNDLDAFIVKSGPNQVWYNTPYSRVSRYRLYNPNSGHHHYTTDQNEYNFLGNLGWIQEDTCCTIYKYLYVIDSVQAFPFYRLYNPYTYEHHWTTDVNEYLVLGTIGWNQEGVDGYVFPSQVSGSLPLYRLYNANNGLHHWTMDANERTVLIGYGWIDEGIACYVFP